MTGFQAVVDAIRGLIPPGLNIHFGEVRGAKPALPWVVVAIDTPGGEHVSESLNVAGGNLSVHVTCAGETEDSVRVLMDRVLPKFRGQRVHVPGFSVGAFVEVQGPRIYPEEVNLDGASRHLMVGTVGWKVTVSQTVK